MTMPPRLSVWALIVPARKHWLTWVITVDFVYGAVDIFAKAGQPYQRLMASLMPLQFWYGLFIVTAGLLMFGWWVQGGILGTIGWGSIALTSIVTITNGSALSYGAAVSLLGWAGVHAMITFEVTSGLSDPSEPPQEAL